MIALVTVFMSGLVETFVPQIECLEWSQIRWGSHFVSF